MLVFGASNFADPADLGAGEPTYGVQRLFSGKASIVGSLDYRNNSEMSGPYGQPEFRIIRLKN